MTNSTPGPYFPHGPVDPLAAKIVGLMAQEPAWQNLGKRPAAESRKAIGALMTKIEGEPVAHVEELTIAVGDAEIGARLYRPTPAPRGLIVWVHGGGFVLGDVDGYDSFTRLLANRSRCAVVSLDYRLAPEHPFPTAVHDVLGATLWIANRRDTLAPGGVPMIIAGDSAGGNLATVTARKLAETHHSELLAGQILVYPCTDDADSPSLRRFVPPVLPLEQVEWFFDQYDPKRTHRTDPDFAPILAGDLSKLPPTLIITAEHDILTEQAEHYGRRLAAAGVPMEISRHDGMIHGFATMDAFFPTSAGKAVDEMVAFVDARIAAVAAAAAG